MDAKRREGVAIILESSRELERDGDGPLLLDLGLNRYGRRRYEFALEVRVPGIEPYTSRTASASRAGSRTRASSAARTSSQIEAQQRLLGEQYARKHKL